MWSVVIVAGIIIIMWLFFYRFTLTLLVWRLSAFLVEAKKLYHSEIGHPKMEQSYA